MAHTKEQLENDKLFGKEILAYTAQKNAQEIVSKLGKSEATADEVMRLAKIYEVGTYRVTKTENETSVTNNYHAGSGTITYDDVEYGLTKNLSKSLYLLNQLKLSLGITTPENKELKDTLTSEIKRLVTLSDSDKYANAVLKLNEMYGKYQKYLQNEIEKTPFTKTVEFEAHNVQKKRYPQLSIDPSSPKDTQLQELINKYNATVQILHALDPQNVQTDEPFKQTVENYKEVHDNPNIGGVIQKDRSTGEQFFNEAARILVMVITLGFKQDFKLLKSEGQKQLEEAEQHIPSSPSRKN